MNARLTTLLIWLWGCGAEPDCPVVPTDDTATDTASPDTDECSDLDADGVCDIDDICDGHDVSGDTDGDGTCDNIDTDDDNDGVPDGQDIAPTYPYICTDTDKDTCDDCYTGTFNPADDGDDWDGDGLCDVGDEDDDNDGVSDTEDSDPWDPYTCADTDKDTCDDCSSGSFDPKDDGDDWDEDGLCDAVDPERFSFAASQVVDGQTITCSATDTTSTYTECTDLQVNGLYFPNGITCGPEWSTTESAYTSHADFCTLLTGSAVFEVYYNCDTTQSRVTHYGGVWSTAQDNGFTQNIRCFY